MSYALMNALHTQNLPFAQNLPKHLGLSGYFHLDLLFIFAA